MVSTSLRVLLAAAILIGAAPNRAQAQVVSDGTNGPPLLASRDLSMPTIADTHAAQSIGSRWKRLSLGKKILVVAIGVAAFVFIAHLASSHDAGTRRLGEF